MQTGLRLSAFPILRSFVEKSLVLGLVSGSEVEAAGVLPAKTQFVMVFTAELLPPSDLIRAEIDSNVRSPQDPVSNCHGHLVT
mmetsp:Transcript_67728/g.180330  ORF Transcript_67728/g.180330 Transcript_67728/m.180330 type:complete len:83 (-) Transcript_67728:143-391(-)